jgi:hypothetical protein
MALGFTQAISRLAVRDRQFVATRLEYRAAPLANKGHDTMALQAYLSGAGPTPSIRNNGLVVVHVSGVTHRAGDVTSFGIIGISEIARLLP